MISIDSAFVWQSYTDSPIADDKHFPEVVEERDTTTVNSRSDRAAWEGTGVVVDISAQAQAAVQAGQTQAPAGEGVDKTEAEPGDEPGAESLSKSEQNEVKDLEQRDRDVRAHERAHLAAAGSLARGGASFEYKTGPDGKRYAVGGEVSIDTSDVDGDPEATIRKAARIRQAASAPSDPSPQDRRVSADADAMAAKARQELAKQQNETGEQEDSKTPKVDLQV